MLHLWTGHFCCDSTWKKISSGVPGSSRMDSCHPKNWCIYKALKKSTKIYSIQKSRQQKKKQQRKTTPSKTVNCNSKDFIHMVLEHLPVLDPSFFSCHFNTHIFQPSRFKRLHLSSWWRLITRPNLRTSQMADFFGVQKRMETVEIV